MDMDAIDPDADPAGARRCLGQIMEEHLEPLERHRLTAFYEDGEEHMIGAMRLREILAMKQHQSHKPIRPYDVIRKIMEESGVGA